MSNVGNFEISYSRYPDADSSQFFPCNTGAFIDDSAVHLSKSRPWSQEYNSRADQTYERANKVPSVRLSALDDPQPQERGHDINTAISRVGPPRKCRIDSG